MEKKGIKRPQACQESGLNLSSLTDWGNGTIPSIEKIVRITEYLGFSLQWIVYGGDIKK
ncbi:MAG: helix-turn-helix domain-containing protein [Treponema sp.]|nr:helix-turn-helix domain-containing protein [Treponema sp.]